MNSHQIEWSPGKQAHIGGRLIIVERLNSVSKLGLLAKLQELYICSRCFLFPSKCRTSFKSIDRVNRQVATKGESAVEEQTDMENGNRKQLD